MKHPDKLRYCEFWTSGECAAVLGRSGPFWRALWEKGIVAGYESGGPKSRAYIQASSARAYLAGESAKRPTATDLDKAKAETRAALRRFRQRQNSEVCSGTLKAHSLQAPTTSHQKELQ